MSAPRVDIDRTRTALIANAAEIGIALLGPPNRKCSSRREVRWGSKGSLVLTIVGSKAGYWYDHELGKGGDLFQLIQREHRCDFKEALRIACDMINHAPVVAFDRRPAVKTPTADCDEFELRRKIEIAFSIWHEARPVENTLADAYLRSRGLSLLPDITPRVLRFHPRCIFGPGQRPPALVALIEPIGGGPAQGIHRTALTADGRKVERKALGRKSGGVIKLTADENIIDALFVGEGIETTLAGMLLGYRPAWSCVDAGGLAKFPVITGVQSLGIFVDRDEAGERAALTTSQRWTAAGREVRRLIPRRSNRGTDLNDVARARGLT